MKEFILDTNVFLRYFLGDIQSQYQVAKRLIEDIEKEKIKAFVSILVINEIVWIMRRYYGIKLPLYIPKLSQILLLKNIEVIEIEKTKLLIILQALLTTKFDFTDLYLSSIQTGKQIISFDKDFKKIKIDR